MISHNPIDRKALVEESGAKPDTSWVLMNYDTIKYPFAKVLQREIYKVPNLGKLHDHVRAFYQKHGVSRALTAKDNLSVRDKMQGFPADSAFGVLYHNFMLNVLSRWVGGSLSYSQNPKMRVHFPNTPSVSSFHHDIIVTKRIDQINFWLPFNTVDGGATMWVESDYGLGDFKPVRVNYGQVLIFDGGYLGHGSVYNDSDTTRTSMDMRFSLKGATSRHQGVELMNRIAEQAKLQGFQAA